MKQFWNDYKAFCKKEEEHRKSYTKRERRIKTFFCLTLILYVACKAFALGAYAGYEVRKDEDEQDTENK